MATYHFSPTTMTITPPEHCTPTERWLIIFSSAFHTCIPTNLAFLSTALGTCSIISWLFAQLPQIYKNWRLKSASGLSIFFLVEWMLGDVTNLFGALLTDQAAWQVVVPAYYTIVDICLLLQYVWYVHAKPLRQARVLDLHPGDDGHGEDSEATLEGISPPNASLFSSASQTKDESAEASLNASTSSRTDPKPRQSPTFNEKSTSPATKSTTPPSLLLAPQIPILTALFCVALTTASPLPHPKPISLMTKPSPSAAELAGRIFSWISTILYLLSRFPQIIKNARRRSTSGLSPTLFIAAFFGNLFYSSSILVNPQAWASYPPYGLHGWVGEDGSERWEWVGRAAPFWLGAAGVLFLDAVVGGQFLWYGEGVEVLVDEGKGWRGRSRWMKVSGWMRGWVPSPRVSPGGNDDNVEVVDGEGRPLLVTQRQRSDGHERDGHERNGYGGVST